MNYKKIYDDLIQYRKVNKLTKSSTCYCECHHITPKCMNGSDKESNLVNLTAREHYIAHLLLWKHYKDINPHIAPALLRAITCMQRTGKCIAGRIFRFNSKLYNAIKVQMTVVRRNMINITDGKIQKKHDKRLPIPDGWYKGSINHNFKDSIMITNGIENRRISKSEIIPNGWYSGTTISVKHICITNGIENRYINPNDIIPDGWHRGSHVKPGLNRIAITNGIETRFIPKDQPIPDGWTLGNGSNMNKRFITNGSDNKMINAGDSLPDGWHYGATFKCKNRKGVKRIKNERLQKESKLAKGQVLNEQQILDGWEYGALKRNVIKATLALKASKNRKVSKKFTMSNAGKIWVNNGLTSIRVYPNQIPNGYVKGRLTPLRSRKVNN